MKSQTRSLLRGAAAASALLLALAACGGGSGDTDAATPEDVQAALEEGGSLTVWTWDTTVQAAADAFEEQHPNVDVEVVNAGTGNDQYTALQNAIKAGKGVPDLAQVEYFALPQFALSDALADLGPSGASDSLETFAPGPASAIQVEDGVYGLPLDSGPMAMFYNADLFEQHDIDVPTTWAEYVEAGRRLHAADPEAYITNDTGDAGFATSLIWQAGGKPFRLDGTQVSIDLADEGSRTFTDTWQQMIDDDLVAPISSWSDEWFQGLNNGTIATLVTGAWMPTNLETGAPDGAGKWRVAPMPQWIEGGTDTAENGGSSLAVPAAGDDQALAYAFAEFTSLGDGVQARIDGGAFPATTADLESPEFLGKSFDYFGGQKANEVFAASSRDVVDGWSYLPFQVYANSVFNDTAGQAYVSDQPLAEAMLDWQETVATYGDDQGFEVSR